MSQLKPVIVQNQRNQTRSLLEDQVEYYFPLTHHPTTAFITVKIYQPLAVVKLGFTMTYI